MIYNLGIALRVKRCHWVATCRLCWSGLYCALKMQEHAFHVQWPNFDGLRMEYCHVFLSRFIISNYEINLKSQCPTKSSQKVFQNQSNNDSWMIPKSVTGTTSVASTASVASTTRATNTTRPSWKKSLSDRTTQQLNYPTIQHHNMTPARRHARSDPPPHRRRRARSNSETPWLWSLILRQFWDPCTPLLFPPGTLHIPPGRPTSTSSGSHFRIQNRIQNFKWFLNAFWLPKLSKKSPKIHLNSIRNTSKNRAIF